MENKAIRELLISDEANSPLDCLEQLAWAAEHLLEEHNCDHDGYEYVSHCAKKAHEHLIVIRQALQEPEASEVCKACDFMRGVVRQYLVGNKWNWSGEQAGELLLHCLFDEEEIKALQAEEPCKTCGGSGEIDTEQTYYSEQYLDRRPIKTSCPDCHVDAVNMTPESVEEKGKCEHEPEQGEVADFVKKCRYIITDRIEGAPFLKAKLEQALSMLEKQETTIFTVKTENQYRLDRAREKIAQLQADLEKYGEHRKNCSIYTGKVTYHSCTCGLDKAKEGGK